MAKITHKLRKPERYNKYYWVIQTGKKTSVYIWYSMKDDEWKHLSEIKNTWYSNTFHCKSIRAFRRHLKRWGKKTTIPIDF